MKYRRLALIVLASACIILRAQDDDDRNHKPPTEIPDFSNLDEYIYEPKSAVQLSFRHLGGAKTSFFGKGSILAPEAALPGDGPNLKRVYHDGEVDPDQRTAPVFDSAGNPVLDPVNKNPISEPVPPDGKTNIWKYSDNRQVNNNGENPSVPVGYIAFHSYSADVFTEKDQQQNGKSTSGLDLAVSHDMGKLFKGRLSWNLIAGLSVNDIEAKASGPVGSTVHIRTDYYSTFGQLVPVAPYDSSTADPATLIANQPGYTDPSTLSAKNAVMNTWKLKGAYYTFRVGPVITIPIGAKFHVDISAGPILVYAGTTYRVTSTFDPQSIEIGGTGELITEADSRAAYKFRTGLYADASLAYDLTDKTAFFAGAVWQTAQGYTQQVNSNTAAYAAKIDLANENGLRAGMSVRF